MHIICKAVIENTAAPGVAIIESGASSFTVDTQAPTVTVNDSLAGTANVTTANVAYTYTFNEAVTGLEQMTSP